MIGKPGKNDDTEQRRVATNTAWLAGDRIIRALIGLFIGSLIVRQLGPMRLGVLNYAMSFAAIFYPLADLGLTSIVVRELVKNPEESDRIMGTALTMRGCGGLVALLSASVASLVFNSDRPEVHGLVTMTAAVGLFQALDVIDFWCQSRVESRLAVLARGAAHIVIVAVTLVCLRMGVGIHAYAALFAAGYALNAIALVVAYRLTGRGIGKWRFSLCWTGKLLASSAPLVGSAILRMIHARMDRILVGRINGEAELGVYAVAATIFEGLIFIPAILNSSLFPAVVAARSRDTKFFELRLKQYFSLMALVGYATAIMLTIFAGPVVTMLLGREYARSGVMLVVMGWVFLFVCIGSARNAYLMAENRTVAHMASTAAGAFTSLVANLVMIPRFGGTGAAFGLLAGYVVMVYLASFFHKPQRRLALIMTLALLRPAQGILMFFREKDK